MEANSANAGNMHTKTGSVPQYGRCNFKGRYHMGIFDVSDSPVGNETEIPNELREFAPSMEMQSAEIRDLAILGYFAYHSQPVEVDARVFAETDINTLGI